MVIEGIAVIKDYLTKSKQEEASFVVNPYSGCPCKCLYCYASYMVNFTKHQEQWGDFIDVRHTTKRINTYKISDKKVFFGNVTEPYNEFEEKYRASRKLLSELSDSNAYISLFTKSDMVVQDVELLKKFTHLEVVMSICTLDENFKSKIELNTSSISSRIEAFKELKKNGIKTVVFISPIFPFITDYQGIIEETKNFADEYWFDKLVLRYNFKKPVLNFIRENFPLYSDAYENIYNGKSFEYFLELSQEIDRYCIDNGLNYKNYIK